MVVTVAYTRMLLFKQYKSAILEIPTTIACIPTSVGYTQLSTTIRHSPARAAQRD